MWWITPIWLYVQEFFKEKALKSGWKENYFFFFLLSNKKQKTIFFNQAVSNHTLAALNYHYSGEKKIIIIKHPLFPESNEQNPPLGSFYIIIIIIIIIVIIITFISYFEDFVAALFELNGFTMGLCKTRNGIKRWSSLVSKLRLKHKIFNIQQKSCFKCDNF